MNVLFVIILVSAAYGQQPSVKRECEYPQFQCASGPCIDKYVWCDGVEDCSDGSDERFCYGAAPCLESHFQCSNGRCIPTSGICDKYDDCTDGSDELDCGGTEVPLSTLDSNRNSIDVDVLTKQAIDKAVKYLMNKMTSENAWGAFTPRAIVALAFADKVSPIGVKEKELMRKQLNVQLLVDLVQNEIKMSLSNLALYINALYATCQDPRSFQGMDLVALLRSEADVAIQSDFDFPSVLLTLCVANETKPRDIYKLAEMYGKHDRIGSKALVIMAMTCIGRKTSGMADRYIDHFLELSVRNADIYTKALFMQASNAAGHDIQSGDLIGYQLPDGSFGDALATYNVIPALLHKSLLDVRCGNTMHEEMTFGAQIQANSGQKIVYSLWITSDTGINSHSMIITYDGNKTFYDIMLMAAAQDALYSFSYDQTNDGKKIYSLAGVPNDAESGKSWILYDGNVDQVIVNSTENLKENTLGVDKISLRDKSHFVFWLKG